MDTPVCLGNGNALDTMSTSFIFQPVIRTLALDNKSNIFDTALPGLIEVQDFDFPTSSFSIAAVHTEEFACKKCCFVTAGTRLDGDNSVFLIYNIFRQQGYFYLFKQLLFTRFETF